MNELIPTSGLLAWHKYEAGVSAGSLCNDYSGNGRNMTVATNPPPVIQATGANGVAPAWYFDGTKNPLSYSGSVTPKHVIVVAGYDDPIFPSGEPGSAGLLTGASSGDIFVGNAGDYRFFDLDYELTGAYVYRMNGVQYAENAMATPFGGVGIIEASYDQGFALDGIRVGLQKAVTARKWKGWFAEQLLYNRILSEAERTEIYIYLAMKFRLWRIVSGLKLWPFQPNWSVPGSTGKNVLSTASVAGTVKERVKTGAKRVFNLGFETRERAEVDAARAFWNQHRGVSPFIYRDYSVSPNEDITVRFTGEFDTAANNHQDIDYGFQVVEV